MTAHSAGPTKSVAGRKHTFNVWRVITHEYAGIIADAKAAPSLRASLGYVFMPPGWQPAARPAEELLAEASVS